MVLIGWAEGMSEEQHKSMVRYLLTVTNERGQAREVEARPQGSFAVTPLGEEYLGPTLAAAWNVLRREGWAEIPRERTAREREMCVAEAQRLGLDR